MSRSSIEKRILWKKRLGKFQNSNLTVAQFCQQEQVSAASFYQWKRKLAKESQSDIKSPNQNDFLPVQVTSTVTDAATSTVTGDAQLLVTFPNGTQLSLPTHDRELVKLSIESIANATQGDV